MTFLHLHSTHMAISFAKYLSLSSSNMSDIIQFSPSFQLLSSKSTTPPHFSFLATTPTPCQNISFPTFKKNLSFDFDIPGKIRALNAWTGEGSREVDDSPVSFELQPICSESQFDRVIAEAQQLEEPVIIVWMASWCRKCIYLKPKLEKLAADYYQRLRFYCVDVNSVPHKLVAHAGVTKMPTIQLWKDSKKQAEVIGGHKAYLVVKEVCEMIENECTI